MGKVKFEANLSQDQFDRFTDFMVWLKNDNNFKDGSDTINKNIIKEYILCSAIDYNGIIICGHRHEDCYEILQGLRPDISEVELPDRTKQGFLTSVNRYVNREEAWIIAKASNQIVYGLEVSDHDDDKLLLELDIKDRPKSMLISENLY